MSVSRSVAQVGGDDSSASSVGSKSCSRSVGASLNLALTYIA